MSSCAYLKLPTFEQAWYEGLSGRYYRGSVRVAFRSARPLFPSCGSHNADDWLKATTMGA